MDKKSMRFIGFLLALVMAFSLFSVATAADPVDPVKIKIGSATIGKDGKTTVSVFVDENSQATILQFTLHYDPQKLALESAEGLSDAINSGKAGDVLCVWDSEEPLTAEGSVLDLTFSAKEGFTSGDTAISIDENSLVFAKPKSSTSLEYNSIPATIENGSVSAAKPVSYYTEKADFVVGWDLVLVYTNDEVPGFTYDGKLMYDLSDLGYKFGTVWNKNGTAVVTEGTGYTYVFGLVISGDADTAKVALSEKAALTVAGGKTVNRYDVNNSNTVDINDLVAVAAVYNVNGEYLNEERMSIVLLADVSGNKMVDTYDCSLIKSNTGI